jgi:hypothetical protein
MLDRSETSLPCEGCWTFKGIKIKTLRRAGDIEYPTPMTTASVRKYAANKKTSEQPTKQTNNQTTKQRNNQTTKQ